MISPNPETSTLKTFSGGFLKGLGAPVLLYEQHALPSITVLLVAAPSTPIDQSLQHDWLAIGTDFQSVVNAHGKAAQAASEIEG